MRKHRELQKEGVVSVWVGRFASEDELLQYFDEGDFGRDFDVEINPAAGRELATEETPVPISKLVQGFSYWKHFSMPCIELAATKGIEKAHCMVVVYNLQYIASSRVNGNAPLDFLGTFNYSS